MGGPTLHMQMLQPDALTPLDYALDVCLMHLPKLVTAELMVQYHLPLIPPFFVDSVWAPVFAWLLTRDLLMGVSDVHALLRARLDTHVRNLRTLAVTCEGGPDPALRSELSIYERLSDGLTTRPQPPSPHTTWEDVVHLLSTCADLASHVRLFASLGQCVSGKAVLLGEMLRVACSEHRGLVARATAPVYKSPHWTPLDDALLCPAPPCAPATLPELGPVFGPCIGWDLRGPDGGDPRGFNRPALAQSDAREWAAAVARDPVAECNSRCAPIAPPEPEHRGNAKQRRRRRREDEAHAEARLPPASR